MEQNQRHIMVLEELVAETKIAPPRLGMVLRPTFFNIVVVQPSCSIIGKLPEDARIYRIDKLVRKIRGEDLSTFTMLKMVSAETLHLFAAGLVNYHVPAPVPVVAQPEAVPSVVQVGNETPRQTCHNCGGHLSAAEANYCRSRSARFAGQLLCRKCQGYAPKQQTQLEAQALNEDASQTEIAARCASCGRGVDGKVLAFCRFNAKKLAGRVLCRACQLQPVVASTHGERSRNPMRLRW